ncbi:hypothetical protein KDK92_07090 [Oceanirhabdus seepicola]|uniref:Peptidase MA-like domain-containing protein n=2 Tax=Oceanirhabdus seepicola TaxID=2828781 RepID=A0A9J6P0R4_9CLOT|nr:hypothetical protein [Oceanirhabdus seepicola]
MMIREKINMIDNTNEVYKLCMRKETEQFIIYYTQADKTCIDKVLHILEENYSRITDKFNQKLQEKLTIEIHSEHKELLKALGFPNAPKWVRGGIGVGKILIASPLNPPYGSDFDGVVKTAVHEFIHIIVNKINSNIPRWLNEGIASYEAKDNNENWIRKTIINGLQSNSIPTFKDLDTGEDFETFFKRDGYQYAYTIVESLVQEFGYDKLNDFVKTPNDYLNVFGLTEIQLQDKWMEFIRRTYQ